MKRRLHIILAVLVLATSGMLTSCTHNAGVVDSQLTQPGPAGPRSGNWIISYLVIRTEDMSHHLDGYTFTFKEDGTMSVNNKVDIIDGSWKTNLENNMPTMVMGMAKAEAMLAELNRDWTIATNNDTSLQLTRGAGFTYSEVHFTKQ